MSLLRLTFILLKEDIQSFLFNLLFLSVLDLNNFDLDLSMDLMKEVERNLGILIVATSLLVNILIGPEIF